jgi:dTDP-4-dehydrorhamnose 3,5-epimerase
MKITPLEIPDVLLIESEVFHDSRGFFFESFNQKKLEKAIGRKINFVQDNHSMSNKGVLRGLHFQREPKAQGKLVRVVQGAVFDVAVDIRKSSATFGKWVGEILSSANRKQLWIPEGFAHGYLTLSETSEFLYKVTEFYNINYESGLFWNDHDINITWPFKDPKLSEKDRIAHSFKNILYFS